MLYRTRWVARLVGLAGVMGGALVDGCAEHHFFDAGADSPAAPDGGRDASDAPDIVPRMQCGLLSAPPIEALCDLDLDCYTRVDERPSGLTSALDRSALAIGALGYPTLLFTHDEDPTVGVLATRDGTSPWLYDRLTVPMARGAFAPGSDALGAACTEILIDDGAGTVHLVEHTVEGDVELDRMAGTLGQLRSLAHGDGGVFGLIERDGDLFVGFRGTETRWQEVALPGATSGALVATASGIRVNWLDAARVRSGIVSAADIAAGEGPHDVTTLHDVRPDPRPTRTPDYTVSPNVELASGGPESALVSDASGDLVLSRRAADGAWRHDVIGVGSIPSCGPPVAGAECVIDYHAYVALGLVSNTEGGVVALYAHDSASGPISSDPCTPYTDPALWEDFGPIVDAGVDAGPPAWALACAPRVEHSLFLLVADADAPPRTIPLEHTSFEETAALAAGADGSLYIALRDGGVYSHGHRFVVRSPRP
jgi:hypothetical protein